MPNQQATHITKYSARKTSATQTPTKKAFQPFRKDRKGGSKRIRASGKVKIYRRHDYLSTPRGRKRRGLRVKDLLPTTPPSCNTGGCKDLPQNGRGKRRDPHPRLVALSSLSRRPELEKEPGGEGL